MLSHINIGTGKDISIREIAIIMKRIVGFNGKIIFDKSKPDGPPRKLVDVTRLSKLGWRNKTDLMHGLEATYSWFIDNVVQELDS